MDAQMTVPPVPNALGPGAYRMRNGLKAVVLGTGGTLLPLIGYMEHYGAPTMWNADGRYNLDGVTESSCDLVEVWFPPPPESRL